MPYLALTPFTEVLQKVQQMVHRFFGAHFLYTLDGEQSFKAVGHDLTTHMWHLCICNRLSPLPLTCAPLCAYLGISVT